jgi:hypothetical protein
MNAAELIAVVSTAVAGTGARPGQAADPFRAALRLGDVVEGKVVRSLAPGRYAVDFAGFERVVDSAIPFKTDEILYGKVVAIGDRVELQRVRAEAAVRQASDAQSLATAPQASAPVAAAFASLRGKWSPEDWRAAERLAQEAADSQTMSLAASAVAKAGLPFSRGVLEFIHSLLLRRPAQGTFPTRPSAIRIETSAARAGDGARNPQTLAAFAELLRSEFSANRAALVRADDSGDGRFGEAELGALLNVRVDGPVSHAIATLPLMVDGRRVELDVALFQQDRKAEDPGKLLYGKVVIALTTGNLGRVEIGATLVGDHVQIALGSDEPGASEYMAQYATGLRAEVEAQGWDVDEIRYLAGDAVGAPARVVLEHIASKDSFSRLV